MGFESIKIFEEKIAEFFGSPYAVAVDCCTHGVELCLRYENFSYIEVPKRTYISIPFLANIFLLERVGRFYVIIKKIIGILKKWFMMEDTQIFHGEIKI